MIEREAASKALKLASQYPVLTITGPRQSGKTTLCRMIFGDKAYVSLEDVDERGFARSDPRGFLNRFPEGAIIDEVQRAPDLLSYIQTIVDENRKDGFFILTGSQQFELLESISQSLAGRTAMLKLMPFTLTEAYGPDISNVSLEKMLYTGLYPRIFDKGLDPTEAMSFYVNTYVERDLRMLINVKDLSKFEIFLKLCAGRTGQILNMTSLGNDCGVNHATVKSWLSVLEASYIVKLMRPYYRNFNKRLVKSPKLYFWDTGLAAFLLDIQNEKQMATHPLKGMLFESFVASEMLKHRFNAGKTDHLYFFRDNSGNEVDLICDHGIQLDAVEIKSGQTVASDFFKGLTFLSNLTDAVRQSYLVYGGEKQFIRGNNIQVTPWRRIQDAVETD
ncbi:MAG: ATP-binding protein [Thermodesulfobacteriota bacterium]